ncbi:MAG: D-alanine--D-alanine ligase family protein, partial [Bacteroidota bacterium]
VSLVSAASAMNALDKEKYEVIPIGISPEGRWLSSGEARKLLKEKSSLDNQPEHLIVPDPRKKALVPLDSANQPQSVDVLFPVLHGPFGEDGTIQGLFELANIPYVGAGVLGSAVGMDKVVQKELLRQAKIPVTPSIWFLFHEFTRNEKKLILEAEKELRYPMFIKPANLGSSIGISKAHKKTELIEAIRLAGEYDRKILVEKGIENAREIECSVLGNDDPVASVPGEVIPSNEFYDYDAKYVDGKSTAVIPAKLPKPVTKWVQQLAAQSFKVLDCSGMARVDFLVTKKTNKVYLNEINTIPGFTSISMYPKLWQASGVSYAKLLDRLIQLAVERHKAKQNLKTTFEPKKDWYR